jgi:hypothetical protein
VVAGLVVDGVVLDECDYLLHVCSVEALSDDELVSCFQGVAPIVVGQLPHQAVTQVNIEYVVVLA